MLFLSEIIASSDHFLKLPWRIYRNDPFWVPPLLFDQKQLLNRRKHPFHQHAEVEYFVAWRGEEAVGRIAAIVNHQYVQFHEEATGFFGFFESIHDVKVATALLATAEQWVADRGMQQIRGPMNFSTNEECALLIDGFDSAPAVMMPYNPTYYPQLLEGSGYAKAKDLLAYLVDGTVPPPPRLVNGAERLRRRSEYRHSSIQSETLQARGRKSHRHLSKRMGAELGLCSYDTGRG